MPSCPVCGVSIDLVTTVTAPFCSGRCRTVDLGRWLGESYGLPAAPSEDGADEEDPGPGPGDEA